MIMHERIQEEMEIMIWLFLEEYKDTPLGLEGFDVSCEQALDNVIFNKYMNLARL